MIYHYFGDKEALYLAVLEAAMPASARPKPALRPPDPAEGIEAHRLHLAVFPRAPRIPEPAQHREPAPRQISQALARGCSICTRRWWPRSRISCKRGVARGDFRNGADPVHVYISIASLGFFYLSNRWTLSTIFAATSRNRPS